VLLTGDGGWAGLDQDVAAGLAARGVPVVALNSLRYFWKARDPDGAARDLERVIRAYGAMWKRSEILLLGYSSGADVLPFLYNRLDADTRHDVRGVALLGLGANASFQFHVTDWIPTRGA
jgi:type IV secretory pathway VirJ component